MIRPSRMTDSAQPGDTAEFIVWKTSSTRFEGFSSGGGVLSARTEACARARNTTSWGSLRDIARVSLWNQRLKSAADCTSEELPPARKPRVLAGEGFAKTS